MNKTPLSVVLGGVEVPIKFNDGTDGVVKVRELPMRLMQTYLAVYGNEPACVALFCDKPDAWVDGLSRESFERIVEVGEELNLVFLTRYATRAVARRKLVTPGDEEERMQKFIEAMRPMLESLLMKPLQNSPSKPIGNSPTSQT
jgi:hypothetical protein